MKAKEMFEELGYECKNVKSYNEIRIRNDEKGIKVLFDLKYKEISTFGAEPHLFKAIHQQLIELGWIK